MEKFGLSTLVLVIFESKSQNYSKKMKNIYSIILTIVIIHVSYAQANVDPQDNFPLSLLTKHFENLNHGNEEANQYPLLKQHESYSILGCMSLLSSENEIVKKVALARLRGISTQLFLEGKPVILTAGMNSAGINISKNKNLQDDDHIIYVAIADCIVTKEQEKAQAIFNNQTRALIAQKQNDNP